MGKRKWRASALAWSSGRANSGGILYPAGRQCNRHLSYSRCPMLRPRLSGRNRLYDRPRGGLLTIRTGRKVSTFPNNDFISAAHIRVDTKLIVDVPSLCQVRDFLHIVDN